MVRVIKNKSFLGRIKDLSSSRLFIPYVFLFFFIVTIPVFSFVLKNPLEVRQHAATIASGSVMINTDETSFQTAAQQLIPASTINLFVTVLIMLALFSIILALVLYRRRN